MKNKTLKHDRMIKDLEEILIDKYNNILTFYEPTRDCEIDMIGVDGDFADLYEVKSVDTKEGRRNAYWQLFRDAYQLDGYYIVRGLFYYSPKGLFRVVGKDFVKEL